MLDRNTTREIDPAEADAPIAINARATGARTYLGIIGASLLLALAGLVGFVASFAPPAGADHFAQIPLDGDYSYYRNYGDRMTREIQDRDVFYHGIGHSIDEARKADIILLGHSMLLWAFDSAAFRAFEKEHGVRIYNLGSAGDASGEFLRLVIKRWHLHPKLWIINADDKGASFFTVSLDDLGGSGTSSAASVVRYGRWKGYLNVAGRNIRWRIQDYLAEHLPETLRNTLLPGPGLWVWRNIRTGDWHLDHLSVYTNPHNAPITIDRDQDCHAASWEIANANRYIDDIGGAAALMLIPYYGYCPQRVRELGTALNVGTILAPTADYTSADGGSHLDRRGAAAYTTFFLSALEKLPAFKAIERRTVPSQAAPN